MLIRLLLILFLFIIPSLIFCFSLCNISGIEDDWAESEYKKMIEE